MTPFTDDDLKRLKEHLMGDCWRSDEWADARKLMPALLARLEAAEKLVAWEWENGDYQQLLRNWRKAAGK